MINIAILDDEQIFLDDILYKARRIIANSAAEAEITGFTDSKLLLDDIEKYNILLLDIEMKNMNGIELAKRINEQFFDKIKPIIIFVTNYDYYVFQSFELEIFRYLRKDRIDLLLEKYLNQAIEKYLSLLPKYYTILKKNTVINIPYDDIVYVERKGKSVILHLESKTSYTHRTTLKEIINDLDGRFMFIDRCYIVNISKIFSVKNSTAVMIDGTRLSISRSRLNEVKKKISEYWRNKI